jgi:hypothetical protein
MSFNLNESVAEVSTLLFAGKKDAACLKLLQISKKNKLDKKEKAIFAESLLKKLEEKGFLEKALKINC